MDVSKQIETTKSEMQATRPRSHRRTELELRLRNLRLKQLRFENRMDKRKKRKTA